MRANKAYHNSGHGIVAGETNEPTPPGELPQPGRNIDGGGNMAAGNGASPADPGNPQEPPPPDFEQCLGVVCVTGEVPPRVGHTDTEPPQTIITKEPDNPTGKTSATFEFTATDNRTPVTAMSSSAASTRSRIRPRSRSNRATSSRRIRTSPRTPPSRSRASAGPSA